MQSLLRWSIENSNPEELAKSASANANAPRNDLDPGIIDAILGKSDAVLMKEAIEIAVDEARSEQDRVGALDNLEMLVEQIDNANNLQNLKIWQPLHQLSTSESSSDEIVEQALWVLGTALQNNPAAQDAYLSINPLPSLSSFLLPNSKPPAIRAKALYTLSGLLKHNSPAVAAFGEPGTDGWTKLREGLRDPSPPVRRKVTFLLDSLLTPSTSLPWSASDELHTSDSKAKAESGQPIHPNSHAAHLSQPNRTDTSAMTFQAVEEHRIVAVLVDELTKGNVEEADMDFEEKGVGLLRTYLVRCNGHLSDIQKKTLRTWIEIVAQKAGGRSILATERWGLTEEELKELEGKLV